MSVSLTKNDEWRWVGVTESRLRHTRLLPFVIPNRGRQTECNLMDERDGLAEEFEGLRRHLQTVAYRMLGSRTEADDAVQEAWLRLSRAGAGYVQNLGGWLTTVVAHVCLDMLRSRKLRREEPLDDHTDEAESILRRETRGRRDEDVLADSIGFALLTVLETLEPSERVAFVLHDMFDLTFNEIAPIVGRSPVATRQLASRARRRVRGAGLPADADGLRHRRIVAAFTAASRDGDLDALLALLDPNVVVRADRAAVLMGAPAETHTAPAVAAIALKRAHYAQLAFVNGAAGLVACTPGEPPRMVFEFTIAAEKIVEIRLIADAARLRQFSIVLDDIR